MTSRLLLKTSKILEIPTIITEQYPKGLGSTTSFLREEIDSKSKVFEKTLFSIWTPEVQQYLNEIHKNNDIERKQAIVCGIEAHICVFQSCMDLLNNGYEVHLLVDGTSSSKSLDRETALGRLRDAGCYLTTAECVIFDLMRDTKHNKFKEMSSIIKRQNKDLQEITESLNKS